MFSEKFYFLCDSQNSKSVHACSIFKNQYKDQLVTDMKHADYVIVLGGDGFMLRSLKKILRYQHKHLSQYGKKAHFKVFGINYGHVGALLNPRGEDTLAQQIHASQEVSLVPLTVDILKKDDLYMRDYAFNEISVKSIAHQMCHLCVGLKTDFLDQCCMLHGDGVIVSTPAGSTSYFQHAGGAPFPLNSNLIGIQSICSAQKLQCIVPNQVRVSIDADHIDKRPVCVVMDNRVVNGVYGCSISVDSNNGIPVLLNKSKFACPTGLQINRMRD